MSQPATTALLAVLAYALGAVSPAALVARRHGTDLRAVGSGNPGATNVGRALGRRWAVAVGLLDVGKGVLPALVGLDLVGRPLAFVVGVAAVLGHVTSPFLRGRGGKGVATTFGVVLVLAPLWLVACALVFALVLAVTRWMAGASSAAALALLFVALLLPPVPSAGATWWSRIFGLALVVVVLARHRRNLVLHWTARRTRRTG